VGTQRTGMQKVRAPLTAKSSKRMEIYSLSCKLTWPQNGISNVLHRHSRLSYIRWRRHQRFGMARSEIANNWRGASHIY
jgi:hypothetical protein